MTSQNLGTASLTLQADGAQLSKDIGKAQKDTTKKVGALGKKLTTTLTPAVAAIGAAVFAATEEMNRGFAVLQTGTGASGEALEGLKDDFRAVRGTVNASTEEIGAAMADLNTRLGLTGESLQKVTRAALESGIDVNKLGQAMNVFGVDGERATDVMDAFFVASQKTGIPVDALVNQMQTFGPVMKNAGFSIEESTALLANLNEAGVDATRVFPGINAFLRKAADDVLVDYSDAIENAREGIEKQTKALEKNLDVQEKLSDKIDDVAGDALKDHSRAVADNKDDIEKAQQALAIFNARMAEQGDEVKESTRLANGFKQAELEKTLVELRQESFQLAASGDILKTTIEEVTGAELVQAEATGVVESKYTDAAEKIRDMGDELTETKSEMEDLTDGIVDQEAQIETWLEKQAAGVNNTVDLRKALEGQIEAIKNAKTDTEALAMATEAFGAEGAQRLSVAIRQGAFDLEAMVETLGKSTGAIMENADATRTNTEKMALMRQEVSERVATAFQKLPPEMQLVTGGFGTMLGAMGPLLMGVGSLPAMIGMLGKMGVAMKGMSMALATSPIGIMLIALAALVAAGILIYKNWDKISAKAIEIWDAISAFLDATWGTIVGFFRDNWKTILGILFPQVGLAMLVFRNWGKIVDTVKGIWKKVKGHDLWRH